VEKHFHTTSRGAGEHPNSVLQITETQIPVKGHTYRGPVGHWYLSDGHLLSHGGLARRARGTNASGGTSLLLKDLPELETLISS
jgi:hypothetical protein